jgi:acylphosphatase
LLLSNIFEGIAMKKNVTLISLFAFVALLFATALAQKPAPANVAAALTVKIAGFNKNLSGDITIYVVGNDDIASELKKAVGKPLGGGTLKSVTTGSGAPSSKPSIIFISNAGAVGAITKYSRANKVLTVTNDPGIVSDGATLGVVVGDDGKPKILLNLTSSVEEGVDWNPAIMKVAQTIK